MIVAVDWDGTLWNAVSWDKGDWLPGAVDALMWMARRHTVIIHSCRGNWDEGVQFMQTELRAIGLKHPKVLIHTAPGKPVADVYIDDKALRHKGDWGETIALLCVR